MPEIAINGAGCKVNIRQPFLIQLNACNDLACVTTSCMKPSLTFDPSLEHGFWLMPKFKTAIIPETERKCLADSQYNIAYAHLYDVSTQCLEYTINLSINLG